ncbi:MAG: substrate-binding domain-containing protein [Candidatus Thorarchaeota archaeon]
MSSIKKFINIRILLALGFIIILSGCTTPKTKVEEKGLTGTIVVVGRDEASGTRETFDENVLHKHDPTASMEAFNSNGGVHDKVKNTEAAIGYVGLGYVSDDVKALNISGVEPTVDNVLNGLYPIARDLNFFTKGAATGLAKDFIDFVLSDDGQALVEDEGFVALKGTGPAEIDTFFTSSDVLKLSGSTTVLPIAEACAAAYMEESDADIQVTGGGSSVGVADVTNGVSDIGMASRELKSSEDQSLVKTVVAKDGIAIIVNPVNSLGAVPRDLIAGIYLGEITLWEDVRDMATFGGDIVVVGRDEASGTRATFDELVLDDEDPTADMEAFNSNGGVHDKVKATVKAIGYVGLGYLSDDVKGLYVDGVAPTAENVLAGDYPISRDLNFFTKGEPAPNSLAKDFIDFVLSDEGQEIVADEGFVALEGTGPADIDDSFTAADVLTLSGSTTVLPIAQACAAAYMEESDADIQVTGGGSSVGVADVTNGVSDIGMASRELKSIENTTGDLVKIVVAADGIAIIVHPDNPTFFVLTEDVKDIYVGNIGKWDELLQVETAGITSQILAFVLENKIATPIRT